MSEYEHIVRRARRMPSDDRGVAAARPTNHVLPPGTGTSLLVLPLWRRAIIALRSWWRS
jgi:hypothetical protein